jgi:hypothetical protein
MQKLTRRNVITTLTATSVLLCPAVLNAHEDEHFSWGPNIDTSKPSGQDRLVMLMDRSEPVDVTELGPGQVAVVGVPTDHPDYVSTGMVQYVAILRRSPSQIKAIKKNERTNKVHDQRYLVVNLVCPHKGFAIGITSMEHSPFACTKEGKRHHSIFDASGFGVHGKSSGEYMSVPEYTLDIDGDVTKAVLKLA